MRNNLHTMTNCLLLAGDDVVVVLNFKDQELKNYALPFPKTGPWKLRFNGDKSSYSKLFKNVAVSDAVQAVPGSQGAIATVTLPGYSALIFSR